MYTVQYRLPNVFTIHFAFTHCSLLKQPQQFTCVVAHWLVVNVFVDHWVWFYVTWLSHDLHSSCCTQVWEQCDEHSSVQCSGASLLAPQLHGRLHLVPALCRRERYRNQVYSCTLQLFQCFPVLVFRFMSFTSTCTLYCTCTAPCRCRNYS